MARIVELQYSAQHDGIARVTRGFQTLGQLGATRAVLHALAVLGRPLTRALGTWAAGRKQRREDEQLWSLAMTDARIMADLSRAMSRNALQGS